MTLESSSLLHLRLRIVRRIGGRMRKPSRLLALLVALGATAPTFAGPGHDGDHDHDEAPVIVAGPSAPRFEAHSDLFEVVGTARDGALSLTLDAYATNEPIAGAQIELESGTYKAVGEFDATQQRYRFAGGPLAEPGTHAITLTVTAGDDVDLLAADFVMPPAQAEDAGSAAPASRSRLLWLGGGLVAALALAFGARKTLRRPGSASA